MTKQSIIAIDGPAASGKSTLAFLLAKKLGYLYFDTGLMYRAITWQALHKEVDVRNESEVTKLANETVIEVLPSSVEDGRPCDVIIEEQDITWEIKKPVVEGSVSVVAAYQGVRAALTAQQRRIGLRGNVVMVGRDIGTVVLPDADLKIYLDASAEERARRRFSEMQSRGESSDYAQILAKVIERDQIDSNREVAPLKPASDAVVINSSEMDIDAVLNFVLGLLK